MFKFLKNQIKKKMSNLTSLTQNIQKNIDIEKEQKQKYLKENVDEAFYPEIYDYCISKKERQEAKDDLVKNLGIYYQKFSSNKTIKKVANEFLRICDYNSEIGHFMVFFDDDYLIIDEQDIFCFINLFFSINLSKEKDKKTKQEFKRLNENFDYKLILKCALEDFSLNA